MDILLVFAGLYGISGALLKMVRPFYSYMLYADYRSKEHNLGHAINKPNLELTRITSDYLAFSLIGMGFIMSIFSVFDTFHVDTYSMLILVLLQNLFIWICAFDFYYFSENAQAQAKHLHLVAFFFLGIFIVPEYIIADLGDVLVGNFIVPLWYREVSSVALLVPFFQIFFAIIVYRGTVKRSKNRNI